MKFKYKNSSEQIVMRRLIEGKVTSCIFKTTKNGSNIYNFMYVVVVLRFVIGILMLA
jgi:hypothetical protein